MQNERYAVLNLEHSAPSIPEVNAAAQISRDRKCPCGDQGCQGSISCHGGFDFVKNLRCPSSSCAAGHLPCPKFVTAPLERPVTVKEWCTPALGMMILSSPLLFPFFSERRRGPQKERRKAGRGPCESLVRAPTVHSLLHFNSLSSFSSSGACCCHIGPGSRCVAAL